MNPARRNLLLVGSAALAVVGFEGSRRIWKEIGAGASPAVSLEDRHLGIIARIADLVLPATDIPGAIDVGVPAWVAYVIADSYSATDRLPLLGGLDALDGRARSRFGRGIADLPVQELRMIIDPLDGNGRIGRFIERAVGAVRHRLPPQGPAGTALARFGLERRTYIEIKSLIIHGYFTSEPMQRELARIHGNG